jgi:hypothetical protein
MVVINKRRYPRRSTGRAALIKVAIQCRVADLSRSGARLQVSDPKALPTEFVLELSPELSRWCRVVRRSQKQVAVEFIHAPAEFRL